ncbi:MAG: EpsI family protein [Candidatus Omnitrophica bacterium]|nr:EpsI family protein [Candidatus Omnitrophota bacterium]
MISKNTAQFIALVVILVVACVLSLQLFFRERTMHDVVDIRKFPIKLGVWTGKDRVLTEKEYDILETRNLFTREYSDRSGREIFLFIIYSETNRSVFHPPEVCMLGSGFNIVNKERAEIVSPSRKFYVNKLNTQKSNFKELVLYMYKAGELYTDNFYLQQAYLALHQVLGRRVPGATIRVSMPIMGDEKKTLTTLQQFLGDVVKAVDQMTTLKDRQNAKNTKAK